MIHIRKTALAAALALVTAPVLAADFQQLDSNRDQQLSRSELQSFAQQQQQSVDQLLQSFDRDQNQQLSQQEFSAVTTAPMQAAEADAGATPAVSSSSPTSQTMSASPSQLDTATTSDPSQAAQAGDQTAVSPERTTITVDEKPAKITVSNTAPKVIVRQPKPEVSITTQEPVVNVEQAEPQVSVQQAEPRVAVEPGQPAVNVQQAEPRVAVEQPEPEVSAEVAEPIVSGTQALEPERLRTEPQPGTGAAAASEQPLVNSEQPLVNIGAQSQWSNQSVGDLQGETLYDQSGQAVGEIVEVVLDATQQPGLLLETEGQTDMKFVPLAEVRHEQDQLRVSGAERVQSLSDLLEGDRSQLQTITDPNRSVQSLLDENAVSVR